MAPSANQRLYLSPGVRDSTYHTICRCAVVKVRYDEDGPAFLFLRILAYVYNSANSSLAQVSVKRLVQPPLGASWGAGQNHQALLCGVKFRKHCYVDHLDPQRV